MAPRKTVTLADQVAAREQAEAATERRARRENGWIDSDDAQHTSLYARWEMGLARRLYEVWRQAGQLSGERWEWQNQSTKAQMAWLAVARATAGPAHQEQFGVAEIAELTHA